MELDTSFFSTPHIMHNISTNFLVLMSYEFMSGKGIAWDVAEALGYLDIPCRPSAIRTDPIPPKLNHTSAKEISDLIEAIGHKSNVEKARKFVETSELSVVTKGKAALMEWYRAYASKRINKRMDAVMMSTMNTIPDVLRLQEDDSFPITTAFNANDIGLELIGDVICNGQTLSSKASPLVKGLITATLGRVRKTYNKGQTIILGKKVAGGRDLESSLWLKAHLVMKGKCMFFSTNGILMASRYDARRR